MKKRVISAFVLIVIVLAFMALGNISRVIFFSGAALICAWEIWKNLKNLGINTAYWVFCVYIAGQAVIALTGAAMIYTCAWLIIAVFFAVLSGIMNSSISGKGAFSSVSILLYPLFFFSIIILIAVSDVWLPVLSLAAGSSVLCDTFALFGGTLFGRHRLAPSVSPKKTVEGSICGAVFSVIAGLIIYFIFKSAHAIPLGVCLITALIASTFGQIGDLAESLMKRMIGVKDMSDLIPGHGGMLDRADSLLFSIPAAYFCLTVADEFLHFLG